MTGILEKKDKLLSDLSQCESTDDRYRYIIDAGKSQPELMDSQKQEKFLISGCMSQAWLVPEFKGGKLYFFVDSDAAIVKGIMAVLIAVYSGNAPSENLSLSPDFLKEGGITEHLSMNRRNGLSNVVKQIMLYSKAYEALSRQ